MNQEPSRFTVYTMKRIIVILICALIVVAVVWPTVISILRRMDARNVQSQAKNIELSLRLLVTDTHNFEGQVIDSTRESGLSENAEAEVKKLSGVEGDFYILGWDRQNQVVTRFLYYEGEYFVDVIRQENGTYVWNAYRYELKLSN